MDFQVFPDHNRAILSLAGCGAVGKLGHMFLYSRNRRSRLRHGDAGWRALLPLLLLLLLRA